MTDTTDPSRSSRAREAARVVACTYPRTDAPILDARALKGTDRQRRSRAARYVKLWISVDRFFDREECSG